MGEKRAYRRTVETIKVGDRFDRLTITGPPERRGKNNDAWFPVTCDCGAQLEVRLRSLGYTKSCGCVQRESIIRTHRTHGESRTRLNGIWRGIWTRCSNSNDTNYHLYGGRGIEVDLRWAEYAPFRKWALANGYQPGLQIDRKDTDGHYSPENCRWVTNQQNQRNRRNNRMLTAWGETKCMAEWVEDDRCSVSYKTLETRLRNKWGEELAIGTPSLGSGHRRFETGI